MAKAQRKMAKRLEARQRAHVQKTREMNVEKRWATGGMPMPGSQNRHK